MSNELRWGFGIDDGISEPGRKMVEVLDGIKTALEQNNKILKRYSDESEEASSKVDELTKSVKDGEKATVKSKAELHKKTDQLQKSEIATKKARSAWDRAGRTLSFFSHGLSAVRDSAALVTRAFNAISAPIKMGLEAAMFREDTELAFRYLLGSREEADRVFELAKGMAAETGRPIDELMRQFHQLVSAGFELDELAPVLQGVGDVAVRSLDPNALNSFIGTFSKLKNTGYAGLGDIKNLAKSAGVQLDDVLSNIGRRVGLFGLDVERALSANEIHSDVGIVALLEEIAKLNPGGKLGEAMSEQSKTLRGELTKLKSSVKNLVFTLDFKESSGLRGVRRGVKLINELMDPTSEAGIKLREVIEELDNKVGEFFSQYEGEEGAAKLKDDLMSIVEAAGKLAEVFGKVLGVAADLAIVGSKAISKDSAADMTGAEKKFSVGTRALAGAGIGAAVGSVIPGVGTLVGGAVGGLVGAGVGAARIGWSSAFDRPEEGAKIREVVARASPTQHFHGPKFAEGGIVMKPTVGLIGEAGPEAIIPLWRVQNRLGSRVEVNLTFNQSFAGSPGDNQLREIGAEVRERIIEVVHDVFEDLALEAGA